MASSENFRRSRLEAMIVDGSKLTTVEFKNGAAVSVAEQDYDTEMEALKAATSKRGRRLLVWCGLVTARVARPAETSEHPDARPLADARYLAKVFGADHFTAMSGAVALSPDAQTEVIEHLDSAKPRIVLSGMCVNLEQDGIWLRAGRRNVEATLVSNGAISGWIALCEGLDSVARAIRDGKPATQARSELADRVTNELRMTIMQWQRTRTVPPQIWLHGPGGDPSGKVHQALLLNSGCRVAPPKMDAPGTLELTQHIPMLPTALHALDAPLLKQPQAVLRKVGSTKRKSRMKAASAALAAILLVTFVAAVVGRLAEQSLTEKEQQVAVFKAKEPEIAAERARQRSEQELKAEIDRPDEPNWGMLFKLADRFPTDPYSVSSDRRSTTLEVDVYTEEDYLGLLEELDWWAKQIYGPEAYASTGKNFAQRADGKIEVSARLGHQDG